MATATLPPISDARLRSNRQNASKSTGPTTPSGKAVTRRNALGHGLASRGKVVPAGLRDAAERRFAEWRRAYVPLDDDAIGVLRQAVIESLRLEQVERQRDALHEEAMLRARESWDDDRATEANELGKTLASDPVAVAHALEQTPHGCRWLIARWTELAEVAREVRLLPESLKARTFDLLGRSPDARVASPQATRGFGTFESLARSEIARLERRINGSLARIDQLRREAAGSGLAVLDSREARLLNRYEREIRRRLQTALDWLAPLALPAPAEATDAPGASASPGAVARPPRTALHRNGPTCQNGSEPGREMSRGAGDRPDDPGRVFARECDPARGFPAIPAVLVPCPNATG